MSTSKSTADVLLAEIKQVEQSIEDLKSKHDELFLEEARLRAQLDEYRQALRTVAKLEGLELDIPGSSKPISDAATRGKPNGLPSTKSLVFRFLDNARQSGNPGLSQGELLRAIRANGWPHCKATDVSPVLVKAVKGGELRRERGVYYRVT